MNTQYQPANKLKYSLFLNIFLRRLRVVIIGVGGSQSVKQFRFSPEDFSDFNTSCDFLRGDISSCYSNFLPFVEDHVAEML